MMIDKDFHTQKKAKLKKQFEQAGCGDLWYEYWDATWITSFCVVEESIRRAERYLRCDDLTTNERNFVRMVESWT